MTYKDDRTTEQKQTHFNLVAATDSYMSGWGHGLPDVSYCAWACETRDIDTVYRWVKARGDMKRVRMVRDNWRPRGANTHTSIYVITEGHPALVAAERDAARKLAEKYRDAWQRIDATVCDVAGVGQCDDRPLPWEDVQE